MCSKSPKKFEDFAEYDFIGAPFVLLGQRDLADIIVYNSGLSLRNVKNMVWLLEITTPEEKKMDVFEDTWYCLFFVVFALLISSICFPFNSLLWKKIRIELTHHECCG